MGWSPNRTCTYSAFILWILSSILTASTPCPDGFFTCTSSDCIEMTKHCDGHHDCTDGSDETNCGEICHPPNFFLCRNGHCISGAFVCDGQDDCGDSSDEKACNLLEVTEDCTDGFVCAADNSCIPLDWVCDGIPDCFDDTDEVQGCVSNVTCNTFLCHNHHCIPNDRVCDGNNDCMDNSDEISCSAKDVPIEDCTNDKGLFACHDQLTCIDLALTCDGTKDCPDASDEGPGCDTSKMLCPQFGCAHHCVPSPDLPICACPPGFTLQNTKYCVDIDECKEYGICSHSCSNRPGSFSCSCMEGYSLHNSTCKAEGGEPFLVYSTKTKLRGYYLSSKNYYSIVENGENIAGVAYDGLQVYWTSLVHGEEQILRSDEFGTNVETVVNTGLGQPEDLAIDWLTNNIYFTDAEEKHIGVCTTTGQHCTVLVNEDVDSPRAIVLLISKGLMFWSDWGQKPMIARAGMDGSSPTAFISSDIHWPNGIALDQGNERLYWVDYKLQIIESVKFDGTDRRVILKEVVKHPYALAIFEDKLYWSDFKNSAIMSCHKFTGINVNKVRYSRNNPIYGMNIYHPSLHPKMENPCSQAFCSDICLLAPNATYTCACSEDRELGADKHTCLDVAKKQILILGTGHTIIQVHHQALGRQQHISAPLKLLYKIGAMTFNSLTGELILSDIAKKELFTYHLERAWLKTLQTPPLGMVEGLDFDYMGNNLYWSDTQHRTIEVLSLSTMEHKVLLRFDDEVPLDIVVIPNEGVMFVAFRNDYDNHAHLDRYHMDGTSRTHVIENVLKGPYISLAYDPHLRRILWTDSTRGQIESTDVQGFDHHAYRILDEPPVAVASMGQDIFWTTWQSPRLHWSNKYFATAKIKGVDIDMFEEADRIMLVTVRGIMVAPDHPCQNGNGPCSHLCLLSLKKSVCACPEDLVMGPDNRTCAKLAHCAKNQFKCQHDNRCIPRTLRCDGRSDCLNGEDEKDCTFCQSNQFACANGQCIYQEEHCDGVQHCSDGSDELDCPEKPCNPDVHFQCGSGECIDIQWRCDFKDDCRDKSDEKDCEPATCGTRQFRCHSGQCIVASYECDGEIDCKDASDEHEKCQPLTCSSQDFQCNNKRCIDFQLKCNGADDCGDNSDEKDCKKTEKSAFFCKEDEFKCSIQETRCIPNSARCNGTAECLKGEDERNCGCASNQFECHNSKCINSDFTCDGMDDCLDGSDEDPSICVKSEPLPTTGPCLGFQCGSGECIPIDHACNGAEDCLDSSDEGGKCRIACAANNPCLGTCHPTPQGSRCSCLPGFFLKADGKSCGDIDECQDDVCSQMCLNTDGSFTCSCINGYKLRLDRRSCKATGAPMELLFVANGNELRKVSNNLNNLKIVHRDVGLHISGLDVVAKNQTVYWSSAQAGMIRSHSLVDKKQTFVKNLGRPAALAVDWITGNVYFVDEAVEHRVLIKVCNLDARRCAKLIAAEPGTVVNSLAVDPTSGYLFWSETSYIMFNNPSSTIHRAELSGADPTVVVMESLSAVTGLAADPLRRKLYWVDHVEQKVECSDYNGDGRHIVFQKEVKHPTGLAMFEDDLYWISGGSGSLAKCKVLGQSHSCKWIHLNVDSTDHFAILQSESQAEGQNSCLGKSCSHLCVLGVHGPRCICEDGTLIGVNVPCEKMTDSNIPQPRFSKETPVAEIAKESSGWSPVATVFIVLLIVALVIAGYWTYQHRWKGKGKFDISFRFKNPTFGPSEDAACESQLKPGRHEYVNPLDRVEPQKPEFEHPQESKLSILKKIIAPRQPLSDDSGEEYTDSEYSTDSQKARLVP